MTRPFGGLRAAMRRAFKGYPSRTGAADERSLAPGELARLKSELRFAREETARAVAEAEQRNREYGVLLAETGAALSRQLAEVRIPLHILADSPFGTLNENQEEMIAAARAAADAAELELERFRAIVDADRGVLAPRREPVHVGELVRLLVPLLEAQAAKEGIRLHVAIEPDVPRIVGDRGRLRDALRLTLLDAIRFATPGTTTAVHVFGAGEAAVIEARHGSRHEHTGNLLLAQRIVAAQGGTVADADGVTRVVIPSAP